MEAENGDNLADLKCSITFGSIDGAQLHGRFGSFLTDMVEISGVKIG